jgi:hypothetical protein
MRKKRGLNDLYMELEWIMSRNPDGFLESVLWLQQSLKIYKDIRSIILNMTKKPEIYIKRDEEIIEKQLNILKLRNDRLLLEWLSVFEYLTEAVRNDADSSHKMLLTVEELAVNLENDQLVLSKYTSDKLGELLKAVYERQKEIEVKIKSDSVWLDLGAEANSDKLGLKGERRSKNTSFWINMANSTYPQFVKSARSRSFKN